jgi:hypothetical protein
MKSIASLFLIVSLLSGCVVNVVNQPVQQQPLITYHRAVCGWVEIPIYGYADVYRDGRNHVRIRQIAYVDRQWRCQ